jgi:xanthine dehydrogenase/oxidase
MAIYSQLRMKPDSTPDEIEESLDGNLCRCTGYRPILDGAKSLSNNKGGSGCCGGKGGSGCCREQSTESKETGVTSHHSCTEDLVSKNASAEEEKNSLNYTEPIFPPALMRYERKNLAYTSEAFNWFQPTSLSEFLELKARYPDAKLVAGNTEIGIETKFKGMDYRTFINPSHITELNVLHETAEGGKKGLLVGGGVLLNALKDYTLKLAEGLKAEDTGRVRLSEYQAIGKMLNWFASNHIRNVATIAGNIITASPISDMNPLLLSCKAVLKLVSVEGARNVPISEFFLAYRKVNMKPNEILESVFIPASDDFAFTVPFKQARRREDDISIVTSGMRFSLRMKEGGDGWDIKEAILAFGGMAPKSIIALKASEFLTGKNWNPETFQEAYGLLRDELKLPENVPGGQAEYRTTLAVSFLFKAFLTISNELGYKLEDGSDRSGMQNFVLEEKHHSRGEQVYYSHENSLPNNHEQFNISTRNTVGKPITHRSAEAQVTGDAKYTGDIPLPANAVHAVLVLSTRAHARIVNVDIAEAEKSEGFIRYFGYKDIRGTNKMGPVVRDEELFAEKEVKFFGAVSILFILFILFRNLLHSNSL